MFTLNQKELLFPCIAEVDVFVCGGDPAGMSNESGMKK